MLGHVLRTAKRKAIPQGIISPDERVKRTKTIVEDVEARESSDEPQLVQEEATVEVDKYVHAMMKLETNSILMNRMPSPMYSIATALLNNKKLYVGMDDNSGLEPGMISFHRQGKRVSQLKAALRRIQMDADSQEMTIKSWEDAERILSKFIRFKLDEPAPNSDWGISKVVQRVAGFGQTLTQKMKDQAAKLLTRKAALLEAANFNFSHNKAARDDEIEVELQEAYKQAEKLRQGQVVTKAMDKYDEKMEKAQEAADLASSLLRPLTDEEQEIVKDAIYGIGPPGEQLARMGTDSVQRESMHRLQPGQWLNDEIIHYFLVMLAVRDEGLCKEDPSQKRCHFFKSFFMTKLLNEGNANKDLDGKYEYRNVKRWSKKVPGKDIFNLDKVIFPINQGNAHWVCAVAFIQEKRIQMYDSLGGPGRYYLESILKYLKDEHKDKKKKPLPDADDWVLSPTTRDTPRQRNGYDCGVFTCMFADFLSRDCPLTFSQEHITECRERIALSIMNGRAIM